jgi:hypothetical protein
LCVQSKPLPISEKVGFLYLARKNEGLDRAEPSGDAEEPGGLLFDLYLNIDLILGAGNLSVATYIVSKNPSP